MSSSPRAPDDDDARRSRRSPTRPTDPPATSESESRRIGPELRLSIAERDDGADRGTVHPTGATGMERMETWLSVDLSAVVDLYAWR
ncbi:DUF7511 domain-containing protein [Halobellus rarus]|uniref:DUF7511 domain-containing protein n=1 Tax=Halobellus rarus TaxID=1126237 RepID=A0ABD6CJN7_9EURY|nr:hypothetical protein [Halobellus rarus]